MAGRGQRGSDEVPPTFRVSAATAKLMSVRGSLCSHGVSSAVVKSGKCERGMRGRREAGALSGEAVSAVASVRSAGNHGGEGATPAGQHPVDEGEALGIPRGSRRVFLGSPPLPTYRGAPATPAGRPKAGGAGPAESAGFSPIRFLPSAWLGLPRLLYLPGSNPPSRCSPRVHSVSPAHAAAQTRNGGGRARAAGAPRDRFESSGRSRTGPWIRPRASCR